MSTVETLHLDLIVLIWPDSLWPLIVLFNPFTFNVVVVAVDIV